MLHWYTKIWLSAASLHQGSCRSRSRRRHRPPRHCSACGLIDVSPDRWITRITIHHMSPVTLGSCNLLKCCFTKAWSYTTCPGHLHCFLRLIHSHSSYNEPRRCKSLAFEDRRTWWEHGDESTNEAGNSMIDDLICLIGWIVLDSPDMSWSSGPPQDSPLQ